MPRNLIVLTAGSLLLLGCATVSAPGVVDGSTREFVGSESTSVVAATVALDAPAAEATEPEPAASSIDPSSLGLWSVEDNALYGSRFTLKGGYYGSTEDALDDGFIFNASWMNFMSRLFALEFEIGYLDADGSDAGVDVDVWGIPIMLNGRLNVPLWIFDVYGGAGLGTLYYDAEASGAVSADDDGFLLAGNAFLGATINVAEAIAAGLEFKYYLTEDIDDVDSSLDAYALMLTLGWSR